jgi:hypothetical protein
MPQIRDDPDLSVRHSVRADPPPACKMAWGIDPTLRHMSAFAP